MSRRLVTVATLLALAHGAIGQTVSRAYTGEDGKAHVVYANGTEKMVPAEPQQVGCEKISVAGGEHTVARSVLVENCCTSYPIPTTVIVFKGGKKTVIAPGQMIYQWHFIGRGDRISVLFGPVHGNATGANLYNAHTGKVLAAWHGKGDTPRWADDWEKEFAE